MKICNVVIFIIAIAGAFSCKQPSVAENRKYSIIGQWREKPVVAAEASTLTMTIKSDGMYVTEGRNRDVVTSSETGCWNLKGDKLVTTARQTTRRDVPGARLTPPNPVEFRLMWLSENEVDLICEGKQSHYQRVKS